MRQQVALPVIVSNTGQRVWDPARIKLSYHWLWLVPRELASRSRNVPYQDGIRTELGMPVAPGGVVRAQARILAPSVPGLYWLQWDMVEEGATWFAQVAPRQSRRLVVVLPTLAAAVAPLPLGVAILALIGLGSIARGERRRSCVVALAGAGDVWWSVAVLVAKPLVLARETLLEPMAVAYWLALAIAALVPLALMVLLARRLRAWVLLALGTCATLLMLGDVIYYRFFGDILSASALFGAHQTGQVWGSIRSLFTVGLVWLLIDLPVALWMTVRMTSMRWETDVTPRPALALAAGTTVVAVAGLALSAPRLLWSTPLDQLFRNRAVAEQLSPLGYHAYDAWSFVHATLLRPRPSAEQIDGARAWFAERAPLRSAAAGPYGGVAAGRNLIVVQVESLQDFVVDYRIDGQEVMPHLRRWVDDSVRFTNVTDQTSEGRTSDAEFVALTSLLPLDHGAAAFHYSGNHYVGLPSVLAEHGYHTLSAVPFEGGFWNRAVMHPSYGFQQSLFEPDFQLTEQIGWGLNDHDFLQQMVPRLEQLPRPFAAWLITLSLHHPFEDFPQRHKTLKLGALEGTSFGNYLHTMHFFDQALADFRASLERDGLLQDSLVILFGDHDAGFQRDPTIAATIGIGPGDFEWANNDRVPFFVRVPSRDGHQIPAGTMTMTAGQSDFAPTILGLLGIDAAKLPYVGRNLFGTPDDPPVPRPYGDWADDRHLFLGGVEGERGCIERATTQPADPSACVAANVRAQTTREISRLVVSDDLQQRLRDTLR